MEAQAASTRLHYSRWSWLLAPAFAAIYPVLYMYAASIPEANPTDAAICGAVVVIAAIALAYVLRLAYPGAKRASFAAVVILAWCFSYSGYMRIGRIAIETVSKSPLNDYVLMSVWVAVLFILLSLLLSLGWSEYRVGRVYRFVKLACLFAVVIALFDAVRAYLGTTHVGGTPASIWANDHEVMPAAWTPTLPEKPRDIYYMVFDRYGNDAALRRFFNFDNSEFYNELEQRGFIVDRSAITSYPSTALAMACRLNMRFLRPQFGKTSDYFSAVEENEVGKLMRTSGYEYHYFGCFYAPLRKSSLAQWNLQVSLMPTEFAESLVNMTPLRPLIGRHYKHRFTLEKFTAVADLAKNPAATFAYAHFLVPHPPYAFARDGSEQSEVNRATKPEQELYIDQLVATNRMIIETIDSILASSTTKPIIILQADEGPYLMAGDESLSLEDQIAKRNGILNAFLIPDQTIRERLPQPLMPVNTFRFLFKEYFDAPVVLLPTQVFYWETPEPTGAPAPGSRIIDVTTQLSPDNDGSPAADAPDA
jgi:hypothetical protein